MKHSLNLLTIIAILIISTTAVCCVGYFFGPMEQRESQCLTCNRNRVEKWVCGWKTNDEISTNACSDWIDTFDTVNHRHMWMIHTTYDRRSWFGSTSVGCGGVATLSRIYEQRRLLGEQNAQKLVEKFHKLVMKPGSKIDFNELESFTNHVVNQPDSLLNDKEL